MITVPYNLLNVVNTWGTIFQYQTGWLNELNHEYIIPLQYDISLHEIGVL